MQATASIDVESDFLMQQMIRANFGGITVITIAHRLKTIMDSDLILVLEDGHVAEFGSPKALVQNAQGHLSKMIDAHGHTFAAMLRQLAEGTIRFDEASEHEPVAE